MTEDELDDMLDDLLAERAITAALAALRRPIPSDNPETFDELVQRAAADHVDGLMNKQAQR